jgi:voltage-gated potassium channel
MSDAGPTLRQHSNAYEIFILVLTIFSLALMVLAVLPLNDQTKALVNFYDNIACLIFLADFTLNITGAKPKRAYFIGARGWLDLLGSIPSVGFFQYAALFRLARLSRLARILRLLRGSRRKELVADLIRNRGSYATFITILSAGIVLSTASILVLEAESHSPDANIVNGGDALWWALVTITTVGYGDFYPVTTMGRVVAFFVMIAGVGIIGALASILASLLVTSSSSDEDSEGVAEPAEPMPGATAMAADGATSPVLLPADVATELASLRAEVAALREALTISSG